MDLIYKTVTAAAPSRKPDGALLFELVNGCVRAVLGQVHFLYLVDD